MIILSFTDENGFNYYEECGSEIDKTLAQIREDGCETHDIKLHHVSHTTQYDNFSLT